MLSTSVKFYACCRYLHGIIDLLTDLARRHQVRAADVAAIGCGVLAGGWSLVAHPLEAKRLARSEVDAQFSAPFVAAAAVARGRVALADFRRAPELGRELGDLMGRVECFTSASLEAAYPARWGAAVWVRLRSGTTHSAEERSFRGSPDAPPSWDDIAAKLAALVGAGPAAELVRQCRAFGGPAPAAQAVPIRLDLRDRTAEAAREAA
jgi:2-methylcitrate dehydratase PrpD